jgi:hypothetical protein
MASLSCSSILARSSPSVGRHSFLCTMTRVGNRCYSSSSPIASTSKSMLTTVPNQLQLANHSASSTSTSTSSSISTFAQSLRHPLLSSGLQRDATHRFNNMSTRSTSRGLTTMTRQPEAPEEPEVFSGGEPPTIILTDRAIQVSQSWLQHDSLVD